MSCKSESIEPAAQAEARGKALAREAEKVGQILKGLDQQIERNLQSDRALRELRSQTAQAYERMYAGAQALLMPAKIETYPQYS